MSNRIQTFEKFWDFYISQHMNPICRNLHIVGTSLAILCVILAITISSYFVILAPLVGYSFAWIGHFIFEKNKPATFSYPWWSFISDLKMLFLTFIGRMDLEIQRIMNKI